MLTKNRYVYKRSLLFLVGELMKAISMINMKGGVGKTATTVNLACFMARDHDKKTLIIDLDPQTNATYSLVTPEEWEEWTKHHGTLYDVLNLEQEMSIDGGVVNEVDINDCIMEGVVDDISNVDLLPSHLKCVDMDIRLVKFPNAHDTLRYKLEAIKDNYDLIFCDCPPNLSLITQNGMNISDYYVIPIEPDFLAAIGAGLLEHRIKFLKKLLRKDMELLGVVFTKVRTTEDQMRRMMAQLKVEFGEKVFDTIIPKNVDVSRAAENALPIFFYKENCKSSKAYESLAKEFIERIGDTDE